MKSSRYNFFFPYEQDEDKMVAYNSFSNALALMEKSKYERFVQFMNTGEPIEDEEFVSSLEKANFVIDDEIDELEIIRFRMMQSRYNTSSLSLTIAVTADCNFRCVYCYEKDVIKPTYMSTDVLDGIVKLVKNQSKNINNLHVSWYGGEPLMAMDTVERLTDEFLKICTEEKIQYSAYLVTNGYFLSQEIVSRLKDLKIYGLQVTVDGTEKAHNTKRPAKDGSDTFDIIMRNLKTNLDELPRTSLRVNVERNNVNAGREIYEYLEQEGMSKKITPYLGRIQNDNHCYQDVDCLSSQEYAREDLQFIHSLGNRLSDTERYPTPVYNFCTADSYNAFVIAADGRLYRCWTDIGNIERVTGSVLDQSIKPNRTYLGYMMYDPTVDSKCSKCSFLPICMGGCPFRRLNGGSDACSSYRYILNEALNATAKKIKERPKGVAI